MHKNFGEWYGLVSIEKNDDVLKKRWEGVSEWKNAIQGSDAAVLETARIFLGRPEKTSRENFLEAFVNHDAAFSRRGNELEQRLLAGATLVQCVVDATGPERSGIRAAVLAGAALEASKIYEEDATLDELKEEILAGLREIASQQRARGNLSTTLLTTKERTALKTALEADTSNHLEVQKTVSSAFSEILKAVQRSESALHAAAHAVRCADEETDILWWLLGGSSRDLDLPWKDLKSAAPVLAGWELADLTNVALGPQDASALLRQVVTAAKCKDSTFFSYINSLPEDWAKECSTTFDENAIDLTPISLAIAKRTETNPKAWREYFESVTGLETSSIVAPANVARLAYAEAILHSTLVESGE